MRYSELYLKPKWRFAKWICPYCGAKCVCNYERFCKDYGRPEEAEHERATCPIYGESYCFHIAELEQMEE